MLLLATNVWAEESPKSELQLRSYKCFKLIGKITMAGESSLITELFFYWKSRGIGPWS
jgi:hypothetical protein